MAIGISWKTSDKLNLNIGLSIVDDISISANGNVTELRFSNLRGFNVQYNLSEAETSFDTKAIYLSINYQISKRISIEPQLYLVSGSLNSLLRGVVVDNPESNIVNTILAKKLYQSKLYHRSALKLDYTFLQKAKFNISAFGKFTNDFTPSVLEVKSLDEYEFEFRDDPEVIRLETGDNINLEQNFHIFVGLGIDYLI